jgi:hypothetical protein
MMRVCIAKIFIIIFPLHVERGAELSGKFMRYRERSFAFSGFQMDAHQYTDEHEKYC